jgi:hypothetical protein
MIETTLPAELMAPQVPGPPPQDVEAEVSQVEEILQAFRDMLAGLPEDPSQRSDLAEALADSEPFSRFPGLIREIIDSEPTEEL